MPEQRDTPKKDIVFLSHSSADKSLLKTLKDLLATKTGNSIDMFLSSDGQSIPFGRNWVHAIEQALGAAKLMIVFLSPTALRSHWVFFEAGYTYAKGIEVVPVGIAGVDLRTVPPPLGLLQGFNIASAAGLNNLIAKFNKAFGHTHPEAFSDAEYARLFGRGEPDHGLGMHTHLIRDIRARLGTMDSPEELRPIAQFLTARRAPCQFLKDRLVTHGVSLLVVEQTLYASVDPRIAAVALPLLDDVRERIGQADGEVVLDVAFTEQTRCETPSHKVYARVLGTPIELGPQEGLVFKGVRFVIGPTERFTPGSYGTTGVFLTHAAATYITEDGPPLMSARFTGRLRDTPLRELLDLLVDRQVITAVPSRDLLA